MPKNIEDIIPPDRRKSIRNIPMPDRRVGKSTRRAPAAAPVKEVFEVPVHREHTPPRSVERIEAYKKVMESRPRRGVGRGVWLAIGAAVVVLLFAGLSLFTGGTLAYTPKSAPLIFDHESYSAYKTGTAGLIYSVVKLTGDKGVEVAASGEQDVSRKASGTIVIYNTGADTQTLVATTRFATADGKVYRIAAPVTVPARGSIEAVAYADAAGDAYNIALSDFTLPGLKGTPKYTVVYARGKTPMTGGLIGKEKVVSADNLGVAKKGLQADLTKELLAAAKAQVPEDFVIIPSLSNVTFEDLPQTKSSATSVTVNLRGNLHSVMFKRSDLANFLATKKVTITPADTVNIDNLDSLTFAFAGTPPADLLQSNEIHFEVDGRTNLIWSTDETALKTDLVGRSKSEVPSILNNYPSVASASTIIRPFWKKSFPSDIKRITIKKQPIQ